MNLVLILIIICSDLYCRLRRGGVSGYSDRRLYDGRPHCAVDGRSAGCRGRSIGAGFGGGRTVRVVLGIRGLWVTGRVGRRLNWQASGRHSRRWLRRATLVASGYVTRV